MDTELKVGELRKQIKDMLGLQLAKPGFVQLIMGEPHPGVTEAEFKDDISLALARYIVLDYIPAQEPK